jgi:ubiquitin thioesterase protein OTUB1
VVFGYFEILLRSADVGLVEQELVRLRSTEQTMRSAGIDYDIIIDMFDCTWELFDAIKTAIEQANTDEAVILHFLNEENVSNSIVYHFKVRLARPDRLYC